MFCSVSLLVSTICSSKLYRGRLYFPLLEEKLTLTPFCSIRVNRKMRKEILKVVESVDTEMKLDSGRGCTAAVKIGSQGNSRQDRSSLAEAKATKRHPPTKREYHVA
jgi:hypothetical protein